MNTLARQVAQFAPPTQRLHVHGKPTPKPVQEPWAPFADKDEWEFGKWMLQTLGHQEIDTLLSLNFGIKKCIKISFHNAYTFLKKVDGLPSGPGWTCEMVGLPRGPDGVEHEVELWSWNVDECVAALLAM
ncbi:hypothetical protein BC826DRAFT_924321 [Russula brevipes]|nr:hypothetical protein BC826DRAFT_924321 [Russula brevipes]